MIDSQTIIPCYTIVIDKPSLPEPPTLMTQENKSRILSEGIQLRQTESIVVQEYLQSKRASERKKQRKVERIEVKRIRNDNIRYNSLNLQNKRKKGVEPFKEKQVKKELKSRSKSEKLIPFKKKVVVKVAKKQPQELLPNPPQLETLKASQKQRPNILPFLTDLDNSDSYPFNSILKSKKSKRGCSQQLIKPTKLNELMVSQIVSEEVGASCRLDFSRELVRRQSRLLSYMESNRYELKLQKIKKYLA